MSSIGGTTFRWSNDGRSDTSSVLDNISVWSSEAGYAPNSVSRLLRFIFFPDLYLKRGRVTQFVFFGGICLGALSVIFIQLGLMGKSEVDANYKAAVSLDKVLANLEIEGLMELIWKERYSIVQFMSAKTNAVALRLEQAWQTAYDASFQLINEMETWPVEKAVVEDIEDYMTNSKLFTIELDGHRANVKRSLNNSLSEFGYYSKIVDEFFIAFGGNLRWINIGEYWPILVAGMYLLGARNEVDRVRALAPVGATPVSTTNCTTAENCLTTAPTTPEGIIAQAVNSDANKLMVLSEMVATKTLLWALDYSSGLLPIEDTSTRECQICIAQIRAISNQLNVLEDFDAANKSYYDWQMKAKAAQTLFDEAITQASFEQTAVTGLINLDIAVTVVAVTAVTVTGYVLWRIMIGFLEMRTQTERLRGRIDESDALLYQMLPMAVAKKLKEGARIQPEFFDEATIYFNDVTGFQDFVAHSRPSKVITMLNSLYSLLDRRIELYGCYKVETVSDTYMVVCGVPNRRADHAAAIALMALDLMETAKCVRMGKSQVRIRVGIHSGPLFAGVVGLIMPRYCLFGDTVNTASRMQSTSKALHIQISEKTQSILMQHGGFHCDYRGTVPVKGKGDMKTYWLRGAEPTTLATALFGVRKRAVSQVHTFFSDADSSVTSATQASKK